MLGRHAPQAFSQFVGSGEAQMADLIQIFDPHVTPGTARDQQHADRFDVTICCLRDPRSAARQRSPGRFDRVDRVRLAGPATQLTVGTINLDHLEVACP